jgi:hypothetical protein
LKLDHPRQLALMHALVRVSHIAAGNTFTTAELHSQTAGALGCSTQNYGLSALRYDLSNLRAKGLVEKLQHAGDLPGLSQTLRAHLHPAHRPACHSPFLRTTNINYSAFATRQALPTGRPVSRRSRPRRWPQSRLKHKHNENKIDRYHPQYARLLVTTHIMVCGNRPRFWTTFGPRIL